jgi:hypothetical protein
MSTFHFRSAGCSILNSPVPLTPRLNGNGAYSLSPVTIAQNLDADFEYLHPKQLRRFVLGPFYSAGCDGEQRPDLDDPVEGAQGRKCVAC